MPAQFLCASAMPASQILCHPDRSSRRERSGGICGSLPYNNNRRFLDSLRSLGMTRCARCWRGRKDKVWVVRAWSEGQGVFDACVSTMPASQILCHPDRSGVSRVVEGSAVRLPSRQPQIPRLTSFARNDKVEWVLAWSRQRQIPRLTPFARNDKVWVESPTPTTSHSERSEESRESTLHRLSHHPLDSSSLRSSE